MSRANAHLTGRHAIVTGGGSGIGAAVASALASAGAHITVMGRSRATLEAQAARVREAHGVRAESIVVDVGDEASVEAAFGEAATRLGQPHILVNNAGQAEGRPVVDTTREQWDRLLAVNLTGAFLCSRAVLPAMLEAGAGRIVNIASTAGLRGVARVAAYSASKHGLIGFTRSLALEVAKAGITVNAVCPGYTDTGMAERAIAGIAAGTGRSAEDAKRLIERSNAFGRLVRPEEVADAVSWLCSPGATAVIGQALVLGGEVS